MILEEWLSKVTSTNRFNVGLYKGKKLGMSERLSKKPIYTVEVYDIEGSYKKVGSIDKTRRRSQENESIEELKILSCLGFDLYGKVGEMLNEKETKDRVTNRGESIDVVGGVKISLRENGKCTVGVLYKDQQWYGVQ